MGAGRGMLVRWCRGRISRRRTARRTCGGGGYGPPEEREPERVLCDVLLGKISIERARDIYRVAVRDRRLDAAVTAELRRTV